MSVERERPRAALFSKACLVHLSDCASDRWPWGPPCTRAEQGCVSASSPRSTGQLEQSMQGNRGVAVHAKPRRSGCNCSSVGVSRTPKNMN